MSSEKMRQLRKGGGHKGGGRVGWEVSLCSYNCIHNMHEVGSLYINNVKTCRQTPCFI